MHYVLFIIWVQETFRACSDIRILPSSTYSGGFQTTNTFSDDTTFDIDQFEDYYDDLFDNNNNEIAIDDIEDSDELLTNEIFSIHSVQSQKLRLLKKKLILAKALKGLRKLIMLSNLKDDSYDEPEDVFSSSNELYDVYDYEGDRSSTIRPWWARTNSHGRRRRKKKRRRKKRFSFWYDVLL